MVESNTDHSGLELGQTSGESDRQEGQSPWAHKQLDMTSATEQ